MKRFGLSVAAALLLFHGSQHAGAASKKAKPAGKETAAPAASSNEIASLKGDFKWGSSPAEVGEKVAQRIEAAYKDRLQKTAGDPTANDQVRKQMRAEIEASKKNLLKFDGQKTGYDVSIIDEEFAHGLGESMLIAKEDNGTRYFFFSDGRLYKMFIAFDKETLGGKDFSEFGQLMQARFGKAKEAKLEQKTKEGVRYKLDHLVWGTKSGDGLRLVDRSEFYDVYCLVVYDAAVEGKVGPQHKERRKPTDRRDALVEAVTGLTPSDRDPNEEVVERAVGKTVPKPGRRAGDIKVVSPSEAQAPSAEPDQKKAKASKAGRPGKKSKEPEGDGLKL